VSQAGSFAEVQHPIISQSEVNSRQNAKTSFIAGITAYLLEAWQAL